MQSPSRDTSSLYTDKGYKDNRLHQISPSSHPRTERTVAFAITAHVVMGVFLAGLFLFLCACIWVIS